MFKKVTACFLLVAISLQILNRAVVYIDYYANTVAYAKNCENKARPLMHCNGKCQMMKKLQEQEKRDSQTPERKSINDDVISSKSFFTSLHQFKAVSTSSYNLYADSYTAKMPRAIFHPPGA